MDDYELLERWRAGDKLSEGILFKRYFEVLHRFFANKVSGEFDDLIQQTMEAVVKCRDRFENRSTFRTYVLSIARYQLYEYVRTKTRSSSALDDESVTAFDISPSPSTLVAERRQQTLLLEALRRIPLKFQVALELHYWEDLSGPELAEVLEVPVNTAYSRVRKARSLLKKQLHLLSAYESSRSSTAWEADLRTISKG